METLTPSPLPAGAQAAAHRALARPEPDALEALRRLYVACRDAQFGFALCALFVSDEALRGALRRRALHCRLATDLFERSLRGDLGPVARPQGWALTVGTHDDDGSIVDKYREGEARVLTAFRDALDARLSDDWCTVVRRQFEAALDQYHDVTVAANRTPLGA